MEKKDYYIERTWCKTTNKKEKALAAVLKPLHCTLVTFSDEFTQADFTERLQAQLKEINMISHGRDLEMGAHDYNGMLTFYFQPIPSRGESIASMALHPVKNYIND